MDSNLITFSWSLKMSALPCQETTKIEQLRSSWIMEKENKKIQKILPFLTAEEDQKSIIGTEGNPEFIPNRLHSYKSKRCLFLFGIFVFLCRRLTISEFVIIVLLFGKLFCWGAEVDWRLKSGLAVFGNTTSLICNVTDDDFTCSSKRLQWIGSINYGILCTEFQCKNSTKYEIQKPEACTYVLMIHNFSAYDVNCDYTCSYGVINRRKTLKMNNKDFLYIPKGNEITKSRRQSVKTNISLVINIERIFPEPSCYSQFKDPKMLSAHTNTTKSGTFYKSEIDVNCMLPTCSTELKVVCKFGNHQLEVASEKIDNCNGQIQTNILVVKVALPVIILVSVFLGVCIYMVRKRKRNKKKNSTEMKETGKLDHEGITVLDKLSVRENDTRSTSVAPASSETPLLGQEKVEGISDA